MIKSISMALAVIVCAFARQAVAQDGHATNPLLGTWELVKSRDASASDYADVPKQHRQLALARRQGRLAENVVPEDRPTLVKLGVVRQGAHDVWRIWP